MVTFPFFRQTIEWSCVLFQNPEAPDQCDGDIEFELEEQGNEEVEEEVEILKHEGDGSDIDGSYKEDDDDYEEEEDEEYDDDYEDDMEDDDYVDEDDDDDDDDDDDIEGDSMDDEEDDMLYNRDMGHPHDRQMDIRFLRAINFQKKERLDHVLANEMVSATHATTCTTGPEAILRYVWIEIQSNTRIEKKIMANSASWW